MIFGVLLFCMVSDFDVIFQILVSVLDVVSKSDVALTMARRSRAIVNATWDLETKSKILTRI